jgi:hypothetical protein
VFFELGDDGFGLFAVLEHAVDDVAEGFGQACDFAGACAGATRNGVLE